MASSPESRDASLENRSAPSESDAMVISHVSYEVARYRNAGRCLHEMQERLDSGWTISDVRVPGLSLYLVVFRKDGPA